MARTTSKERLEVREFVSRIGEREANGRAVRLALVWIPAVAFSMLFLDGAHELDLKPVTIYSFSSSIPLSIIGIIATYFRESRARHVEAEVQPTAMPPAENPVRLPGTIEPA